MSHRRNVVKQPRGRFYSVPFVGMAPAAPVAPPKYVRRALPVRTLLLRRARVLFVVPPPVNSGAQALPPQFLQPSRSHQRLRRYDRGGLFEYPVLVTAGPTPIPVPPGQGGGSFSHGWRRRIYRSRRVPMIPGF